MNLIEKTKTIIMLANICGIPPDNIQPYNFDTGYDFFDIRLDTNHCYLVYFDKFPSLEEIKEAVNEFQDYDDSF